MARNIAKKQKKEEGGNGMIVMIIIFVLVGCILFALGIWLGHFLSKKDIVLQGSIELGNDNGIFTFDDLEMKAELAPGETVGGEEAVAYFGFSLDAEYGDNDGRVVWDGKHSAKMIVDVTGTITHAELLKHIEYHVKMPDGVIEAAKKGFLDISAFYETTEDGKLLEDGNGNCIPKSLRVPVEGDFTAAENEEDGMVWSFSFKLVMGWGTRFEGKNPSVYYDEDPQKDTVTDEEVEQVLTEMRDTILNGEKEARYTVYLNAISKENIQN